MLLHPKHKMTVWYIWIAQSLRFHNFNHTFGWVLNVILDWSNIFFHLSATAWCPIGRRCPLSGVGSRGGSDPRLSSQPTSQSSDGEARAQNWPPPPRDVNVPPGRLLISRGASLSASPIREPGNPATPPPLKFWDVWRGDSEASVVSETVRRWGVLVPPSPLISNNWQSGQMWPMWSGLGSRCELEWSTGWSIMLLEAASTSCSTRPTCCPSLYSASAMASSTQVPWRRWSGPYSSVWSLGRSVT